MQVSTKSLPKSSIELTVELTADELAPYLRDAAESLSREHKVPGFRPGKLPYEMAVQRFGAQALHEEAADQAIRDAYVRAVREQQLHTIGSPKIAITMLAPENPLRFTATVAVLPKVTLPDFSAIHIERRAVHVQPADVDRALEDLRKMQPKEALADRPAADTDKVVIDLDLTRDNVPLDGGQARDHSVYLNEEYYLPEVRTALVGMGKGESKTFPITFPKDHYQKHLAGTTATATVTVKDVYGVEYPALDDAFAAVLGLSDLAALRARVSENLTEEATRKARDAEELSILDAVIAAAKFDDLPDMLVTGEARQMVEELERGVTQRGLTFDAYLEKIGKARDQILLDFAPEAVKRVKAALVTRMIAEAQAIQPDAAEVDAEIKEQLARYQDTPEFRQRLQSEEARDYVRSMLRNRKVITWLREHITWSEK